MNDLILGVIVSQVALSLALVIHIMWHNNGGRWHDPRR